MRIDILVIKLVDQSSNTGAVCVVVEKIVSEIFDGLITIIMIRVPAASE